MAAENVLKEHFFKVTIFLKQQPLKVTINLKMVRT